MERFWRLILPNIQFFIIIYALWMSYDLFTQRSAELEEKNTQLESLDTILQKKKAKEIERNKEMESYATVLEAIEAKISIMKEKIELLQKKLPSFTSNSEIENELKSEGELLKIMKFEVEPQPEKNEQFYNIKPFSLKGKATYLQLLVFFERLGKTDRMFNMKSLEITKLEKSKSFFQINEIKIVIETYQYNSITKEIEKTTQLTPAINPQGRQ